MRAHSRGIAFIAYQRKYACARITALENSLKENRERESESVCLQGEFSIISLGYPFTTDMREKYDYLIAKFNVKSV